MTLPYPHRPQLIISTLRNFLINIRDPPPPRLFTFIKINDIFFVLLFNLYRFFLNVKARYRLNTTKYVIKEPKKHQKVPKFLLRTHHSNSLNPTITGTSLLQGGPYSIGCLDILISVAGCVSMPFSEAGHLV